MQYSNPGVPNSLYTNGAVNFDTRQLANQLYMEQRQRAAQRQAEDRELDKLTRGSLGGVFAPDQGDAVKKYQTWKDLRKTVEFDKKLRRNPEEYQKAQTKERAAFQDFMDFSAKSKARHDFYKDQRALKPDDRDDAFGQRLTTYGNTPMLKLGEYKEGENAVDLSNPDSYRYMGLDFDPTKVFDSAKGGLSETKMDAGPVDATGIERNENVYEHYKNNPAQMKSVILQSMGDRKAARYFTNQISKVGVDEIKKVDEAFDAIPESTFKQMGISKMRMDADNPDNQAEVAADYFAKKTFLENLPRLKGTNKVLDRAKLREQDLKDDKEMARFKHGLNEDEIRLRATLEKEGKDNPENAAEQFVDGIIDRAKKSGINRRINFDNGNTKLKLYEVPLSSTLAKAFERKDKEGKAIQPNGLGVDDDGNFYPVFYKKEIKKDDNGNLYETGEFAKTSKGEFVIDKQLTSANAKKVVVTEVAGAYGTPKFTEQAMKDNPPAQEKQNDDAPRRVKKLEVLMKKYNF